MATEFLRGYEYLYARLAGDVTLAATIGDRIYPDEADEGSDYPFCVYQYLGGADLNVLGGVRVQADGVFLVKVVDQTTTYAALAAAADRIDSLLHGTKGPAGSDGVVFSCVREAVDPLPPENADGVQYRSIAGRYRLAIQVP